MQKEKYPPYSMLMPVHGGEKPHYLRDCLASIDGQRYPPSELVLVEDGPLTAALYGEIERFAPKFPLVRVKLDENRGLGQALQQGLTACQYDYVARMDADDIVLPDRMVKQLGFLENNPAVSIVGGAIGEFDENPDEMVAIRRTPTDAKTIEAYAKLRNPLNHQTVVFRKNDVLAVGGYQQMPGFEDYFLWIRLLLASRKLANLEDIVVKARRGAGLIARRRGLVYFKREVSFLIKVRKLGFLSGPEFFKALILRTPIRLAPARLTSLLYERALRD